MPEMSMVLPLRICPHPIRRQCLSILLLSAIFSFTCERTNWCVSDQHTNFKYTRKQIYGSFDDTGMTTHPDVVITDGVPHLT